eukprot:CAMPEP_0194509158 /NCGR_PEP_ID=MMETSP0253-20130528/39694_1 /TAXON_ID=2966 /ORGANISM="Noctiluca scintillans" /LENGTH=463 /DNA_ID=CAMNT_0039352279 /DNA_START=8 /DNA_END=1399 /DNA_ORIENTATION=-
MASGRPVGEIIEDLGYGPSQFITAALVGTLWLMFGAVTTALSTAKNTLTSTWGISGAQVGTLSSMKSFGGLLGIIIGGPLSDYVGRKPPVVLSLVLTSICCVLAGLSENYWSLLCVMFVTGICVYIAEPAGVALMMETPPKDRKIVSQGFAFNMWSVGTLYVCMLLCLDDPQMTNVDWQFIMFLVAVPAVVFFLASGLFLQESPVWLATRDVQAAKRNLEWMMFWNSSEKVDVEVVNESSSSTTRVSFSEALLGKNLFTTFAICWGFVVYNMASTGGNYAFPSLLSDVSTTSPVATLAAGALLEVPGNMLAIWMTAFPRRIVFVLYLCGMGSCLATLALATTFGVYGTAGLTNMFDCCYYFNKLFMQFGGTVLHVYVCELYAAEFRGRAFAFASAVGKVSGILAPTLFELMHATAFLWTIVVISIVNLILFLYLPETMPFRDDTVLTQEEWQKEAAAKPLSDQ